MSRTKIVVIQMKEIIYTAIFVGLGILLILLLIFMFIPSKKNNSNKSAEYNPGVYTSQVALNDTALNIEIVVDKNHINSVNLVNIDDSVTTMYPLVQPALDEIESQLTNDIPIGNVTISESSKYTQTLLLESIESILEKAKPE